jgi:hypothetical protein
MPFLLAQIAPESFLIGGWQAERVQPPPVLPVRVAASSSINAVNFSSACTIKRFPSPRCASAMQIVRPRESNGGHVAQLQPAFLNCLRLFRIGHAPPQHTLTESQLTQQAPMVMPIRSLIIFAIVALPVGVCVTHAYGQDPGRLSMLLLEPIETEDFAKRVHRFLLRDFPEVFAFHLFVLIEELLFRFIANQRFAFARPGFGD